MASPLLSLDLILPVISFLGVLLAYEGVRQLFSGHEAPGDLRNRRMRMIARGADGEDVLRILKPKADTWILSGVPVIGTLPDDLRLAGISQPAGRLLLLSLTLAVVLALAASTLIPLVFALPFAVFVFMVVPVATLHLAAKRRLGTLTRQLPDALDLMARGLRVGHPLNTTMASVAREMADPIASEFGVMVDQIAYGDELVDAFRDLADRADTEDTRFLAVSVAIQHGTGGDLARMLSTLSRVIRDRLTMRRKIKAISAEGRLSALILSLIPVIIVVLMTVLVPSYYGDISGDPLFRPTAIFVVVLVVANAIAMNRLVNFKF